jgi:2,3-diketo-5-methylthio-1-phosphopentane phosphatase
MAVAMHQMGVDCSKVPDSSSSSSSANKKRKLPVVDHNNNNGFHGKSAVDNAVDCRHSNIPLLPRDSHISILLLDIEGCTTSISFVKDVLFPYCRQIFEAKNKNDSLLITDEEQAGLQREVQENGGDPMGKSATDLALYLMDRDVKSATLKSLQGRLWQSGYESGQLQGHVYADFLPAVDWMNQHGIQVCIYSSGSVQAQKLLFGHSLAGDLCGKLHAHFDIPTAGSKKDSTSYQNIAQSLGVAASEICFVSDVTEELAAARSAGLGAAVLSIRPGNAPVDEQDKQDYPVIHSLLQLCGAE